MVPTFTAGDVALVLKPPRDDDTRTRVLVNHIYHVSYVRTKPMKYGNFYGSVCAINYGPDHVWEVHTDLLQKLDLSSGIYVRCYRKNQPDITGNLMYLSARETAIVGNNGVICIPIEDNHKVEFLGLYQRPEPNSNIFLEMFMELGL